MREEKEEEEERRGGRGEWEGRGDKVRGNEGRMMGIGHLEVRLPGDTFPEWPIKVRGMRGVKRGIKRGIKRGRRRKDELGH